MKKFWLSCITLICCSPIALAQENNVTQGVLGFCVGSEIQQEYYADGKLKSEMNCKTGEQKKFYENGNLKYEMKSISIDEGYMKSYYEDGKLRSEEYFEDSVPTLEREYYANGNLKKENKYKGNKGVRKFYSVTGVLQQEQGVKNGLPYGLSKTYYEDGTLQEEITYTDRMMRDGIAKKYHRNGKVAEKVEYNKGNLLKKTCYDESGTALECQE